MINLNTYIIEKLHINKDMDMHDIGVGSYVICLSFETYSGYHSKTYIGIKIYSPFKITEISKNEIEYLTSKDRKVKLTNYLSVNKFGYIEYKRGDKVAILLPAEEALTLIKDIFINFDENKKYEEEPPFSPGIPMKDINIMME